MNKINLLFINFEFPPLNRAGVYRCLNFINNLDKEKYNITVLCFSENAIKELFSSDSVDTNMLKMVPNYVNVLNIIEVEHFFLFSSYLKSRLFSKKKIDRVIENIVNAKELNNSGVDLIIASVPFFGAAFLGIELKNRLKKKLLLDLRDEWSHFPTLVYPNFMSYLKKFYEEKLALLKADVLVTVSEPLVNRYEKRHKFLKNKIQYIPNSFLGQIDENLKKGKLSQNTFKIGYTGSFYYYPEINYIINTPFYSRNIKDWLKYSPLREDWKYRSPFYFLLSLKEIVSKYPDIQIEFHLIGNSPKWLHDMIKELDLEKFIFHHGMLSKNKVNDIQSTWNAFLLTTEYVHNSDHYCIPSKIFDYIKFNIPIIGFVTEGPVKQIMETSNLGLILNPNNFGIAAEEIVKLINTSNNSYNPNIESLTKYSGLETSLLLENQIKKVLNIKHLN